MPSKSHLKYVALYSRIETGFKNTILGLSYRYGVITYGTGCISLASGHHATQCLKNV